MQVHSIIVPQVILLLVMWIAVSFVNSWTPLVPFLVQETAHATGTTLIYVIRNTSFFDTFLQA
jgi:hypothetical protein